MFVHKHNSDYEGKKNPFPHRDGSRTSAHTIALYNTACPVVECETGLVHDTTNVHTWHEVKQKITLSK